MTGRDKTKLLVLLVKLTEGFSEPSIKSATLYRGDARAVVAAIRELMKRDAL